MWNALLVWHREQHSLANSLTLGLGIYIIISPFILNGLKTLLPKGVYIFLIDIEKFTVLYLIGWLICFGLSFLVYRLIKPKYDKDYVIALGAGLLNGNQISPLLKKRVQRGLDFANAQYTATGHYPYMIMSGGQGNDETIPEAQAMAAYAQSVGYPTEYILTEQASKTTFQNMQFSKKLLLQKGLNPNKGIFVTSDYHVFRAGIFAFDNGLKINGLGARTRLYFIYNALIREYIAILARYKKLHVVVLALIILFALADSLISIWFIK
ncbi:YdcF family protein [Periweissella fabalis]|uniref:YdcF family protein n=1 Tax=Periweissella fabalis TaxID=1070421 RepID=A0A7X6S328_9LACO|nr:YdcF family protein [Periweissella fabalis]MCM0599273.1 YdcF family protein [Periweissella fabalis]NKZ23552.1 YdcF family protein [Periweissella fabalis]